MLGPRDPRAAQLESRGATAPPGPQPRLPAESTWQGRYVCRQGVTGLTLTARSTGDDHVEAVFEFYAVPENPGVPRGRFVVTGAFGDSSSRVRLTPQRWLQQPPGYVMVGLDGDFDVPGGVLRGRVAGPGCQDFELRRVDGPAPAQQAL